MPTLRSFAAELILATAAAAVLWAVTGNSLGLWLGGYAISGMLAAAVAMGRTSWLDRALATGSAADPMAAVWLASTLLTGGSIWAWFACTILLYTTTAAAAAIALLVSSPRVPAVVGSTVAVVLFMGWLAYPVWGGRSIDRRVARGLSDYHPLIAVNGQQARLGIWLERPTAYRLTVLGQDVPYGLPGTVWPSATLHLLIAALAAGAARAIETVASPARSRASSPDPR
jgi:hypothetical protein